MYIRNTLGTPECAGVSVAVTSRKKKYKRNKIKEFRAWDKLATLL